MPQPQPYSPEGLANGITRREEARLARTPEILTHPRRTPPPLRGGHHLDDWLALSPAEREAIVRRTIRAELFDELVSRNGVRLDGRVVCGPA